MQVESNISMERDSQLQQEGIFKSLQKFKS